MPSYAKPAPKHRAARHRAVTPTRVPKALKTTLTLSSMAVVATGIAVGTGSVSLSALGGPDTTDLTSVAAPVTTSPAAPAAASDTDASGSTRTGASGGSAGSAGTSSAARQAAAASRADVVTRSEARDATTSNLKADTLSLGQGNTVARSENLSDQAPQVIAQALLGQFGWSQDQFSCLDSLWTRESGWNIHADNPTSSAYGIPQALPGSKMASAGSDWMNNAVTQITWGLGYIQDRYGSPCGAWAHSQATGFY